MPPATIFPCRWTPLGASIDLGLAAAARAADCEGMLSKRVPWVCSSLLLRPSLAAKPGIPVWRTSKYGRSGNPGSFLDFISSRLHLQQPSAMSDLRHCPPDSHIRPGFDVGQDMSPTVSRKVPRCLAEHSDDHSAKRQQHFDVCGIVERAFGSGLIYAATRHISEIDYGRLRTPQPLRCISRPP